MKWLFLGLLPLGLWAQTLNLEQFESDLYSKKGNFETMKISVGLMIEGRYVEDESFKIVDALNVVIGSFFAEDLLTSKGKESLKKTLKEFSAKEHGIDIDAVYIHRLALVNDPKVKEIVEALKREGLCISRP
ncbi:MAG: flagellar basal body-associated FliL family protein [Campylobacterales bacterium]|nr:flagellar basal body-associated FliL family protein [Campylobacterales bacterium]